MIMMVEKGTRGGIFQTIHRLAKANNKYMKNYNKDIISSYLMYLDGNNLYGWAMSQKLPVNGFKLGKNLSRFNEIFIRNYNENSDIGYFLVIRKSYLILIKIYRFYLKEKKEIKQKDLFIANNTKKNMLCI